MSYLWLVIGVVTVFVVVVGWLVAEDNGKIPGETARNHCAYRTNRLG